MNELIRDRRRPYLDGDSFDYSAPLAFMLPSVMSAGECATMIDRIDSLNPALAPVSLASGPAVRTDIRNNERVMFDDVALAQRLFDRVLPQLPDPLCEMKPIGLNERFRCYRYQPGQRFAPHRDGYFARDERERSLLTFIVYLNEGFVGGDTAFLLHDVVAKPVTGSALVFQHLLDHEGCVVKSGVKYVLRSDVMYRS